MGHTLTRYQIHGNHHLMGRSQIINSTEPLSSPITALRTGA